MNCCSAVYNATRRRDDPATIVNIHSPRTAQGRSEQRTVGAIEDACIGLDGPRWFATCRSAAAGQPSLSSGSAELEPRLEPRLHLRLSRGSLPKDYFGASFQPRQNGVLSAGGEMTCQRRSFDATIREIQRNRLSRAERNFKKNGVKALQDAHIWHLEDILLTAFPALRDKFKSSITPPPTDLAIPVHKTEQFPLPAMEIDESTIDGTIQVIETILRTLKLDTPEALERHGVVFSAGDLLSLELLLKASGSRRESKDMPENLGMFMKGSLGLFHAKMAGFKCIGNEYWGTANSASPWSLWRVNTLLGRKAITAGWKAKKLPPYRPITELVLDISLPANILDAFRIHCGRHDLEDWVSGVKSYSEVNTVAYEVYRKLCSAREVARLRSLPDAERDVPLENIMLFNRDALTMRVLRTAIKSGHVGTVVTVLRHWMVMFRGSGRMPKYATALFHVLIDLQTMHPTLRNTFLMNWLVNLSGKPNAFKELDLLQEHQNFWLKVIYTAKGNRSWKWLGMISVSIFTLRDTIRQVQSDFKTSYNGKTHTNPSTEKDLAILREYLQKSTVQTYTPRRAGNSQATPARDLMAEGVKYANGANPLREFRADRRKARNLGVPKPADAPAPVQIAAPAQIEKSTQEVESEDESESEGEEDDAEQAGPESEDEIELDDLAMDEEEFPPTIDAHKYVSAVASIISQMS
ncbi:hypothetical protein C8F01DRAFT_1288251 [Mycena amicta]|nr:hypothetical protein C8F01DRAFT_1288251 [Mycena amicta]